MHDEAPVDGDAGRVGWVGPRVRRHGGAGAACRHEALQCLLQLLLSRRGRRPYQSAAILLDMQARALRSP